MKNIFLSFLTVMIILSPACMPPEQKDRAIIPDENNAGLVLPEGFSAMVVADTLGPGRHLVVRDNGDVFLALRNLTRGHGIVALRDTTGDGRADLIRYFCDTRTTGIDIHKGYLYYSNFGEVYRVLLPETGLVPTAAPELIVSGFPEQNQHQDKTFCFDQDGHLYVNVGAPSNACMEQTRTPGSPGLDPCPQLERQAGIWQFRDDIAGQTQEADGLRYASGIRNTIALDWNTMVNRLYVVQHGRDQLHQFFPELYPEQEGAELPAEEMFMVHEGDFFGWPYCYYDQFKKKTVLAPEYGGDGDIVGRCNQAVEPILAFPGHLAPNDLLFYTGRQFPMIYRNGAFIAFHGSWNRAPLEQEGYYVVYVQFDVEFPVGEWEVFADGFAMTNTVKSPRDAVYRPMGLAQGPDGSLYVSDSRKGRIWRIMYTGS